MFHLIFEWIKKTKMLMQHNKGRNAARVFNNDVTLVRFLVLFCAYVGGLLSCSSYITLHCTAGYYSLMF